MVSQRVQARLTMNPRQFLFSIVSDFHVIQQKAGDLGCLRRMFFEDLGPACLFSAGRITESVVLRISELVN
jgi:hypothetical protein